MYLLPWRSCPLKNGISAKIFVCHYAPAGNINAPPYFRANVLPLKAAVSG